MPEDFEFTFDGIGGTEHPDVRADLTYFETSGGGAVFATSSIAWSGSLSHCGYDNDVSRITATVLGASSTPRADPPAANAVLRAGKPVGSQRPFLA